MATVYAYPLIFAIPFLLGIVSIGLVLVWVAEKSPARSLLQSCSGVVGPMASLLALLFGLFSAFLVNDVTTHTERARVAVMRQASALAVVLNVADGLGERGQALRRMAVEFGEQSTGNDWASERQTTAAAALNLGMLREVMFGGMAGADATVRQTILSSIADMRAARGEMAAVVHSQTSTLKWIAAFVLGVLTQMGVVAVHLGKPRAAGLAVTLFGCGMAFMLWVVLMRLDPFMGKNAISLAPITAAYQSVLPR